MKLVAEIFYSDVSDDYDPYHAHYTIPFEAESLEQGTRLVSEAIEKNTKEEEYVDDPNYIYPETTYVFGHHFGHIAKNEDHTLNFEVKTLEAWFSQYKMNVDDPYNIMP
jgi:hypothetical protein